MIRWFAWCIVVLLLAGCSVFSNGSFAQMGLDSGSEFQDPVDDLNAQPTVQMVLQDCGMAPELRNDVWINTDQPLRLTELRGKVVLIDMWNYG